MLTYLSLPGLKYSREYAHVSGLEFDSRKHAHVSGFKIESSEYFEKCGNSIRRLGTAVHTKCIA
jgi:hypothetical protein